MRAEAEICAMRDALLRRSFTDDNHDGVVAVLTVVEWVCNRLIADIALDEVIETMGEPVRFDPEDILDNLPEAVDGDEATAFLRSLPTLTIQQIAAAARKADRLCKAELKQRAPK